MTDGRANIDLVFRNGLKDYEVLPPAEVWDNIKPVLGRKKKNMFFLRTAAAVAIFISMGILAYIWGYETSKEKFAAAGTEMTVGEQAAPFDIVIPAAIMPDKAEPVMVTATTGSISTRQSEMVTVLQSRAEIPDITPANKSGVNIQKVFAGAMEPLPEIQEPFKTKYFKAFLPAVLQPVIYDDIYASAAEAEDTRWSVLAMVSPTHYSQFTTSGDDLSRQIMASDQGRASYSGGMGFTYKINKKLSVQSGVYYSTMGQELGEVNVYGDFQRVNPSKSTDNFKVLTPNGTVSANNPDIYLASNNIPERVISRYTIDQVDPVKTNLDYLGNSLLQDMKYIELPLFLRYRVLDKKVGVSLVGGVSYNFLIDNSVYAVTDGGKYSVGTTEVSNSLALSSSFGMGMEYRFSKNFSFNIEPTFRYFINSASLDEVAGLHTYSLGIFSGVAYRF